VFKVYRMICIAIICFVMLGIFITGCFQQEKSEPPISNEAARDAVAPDSLHEENLTEITGVDNGSDTSDNSEQKQEPPEVQFGNVCK